MNIRSAGLAAAVPLLMTCSAKVDKGSVQATQGALVSAQVESVRIPFDPNQPMYVVAVPPLEAAAGSGDGAPQAPTSSQQRYGWGS